MCISSVTVVPTKVTPLIQLDSSNSHRECPHACQVSFYKEVLLPLISKSYVEEGMVSSSSGGGASGYSSLSGGGGGGINTIVKPSVLVVVVENGAMSLESEDMVRDGIDGDREEIELEDKEEIEGELEN